jgi:hypothetical protein
MEEPPLEFFAGALEQRSTHTVFCCPQCGSFLDAPRMDPETGELARKCAVCWEWHPLTEAHLERDA